VLRIRSSKYAPYGDDQKGERERERDLRINAEVEENAIPRKTVCSRIFMSQLEVRYAEITPRLTYSRGM
jgi:hypothetical protein